MFRTIAVHMIAAMCYLFGIIVGIVALVDVLAEGVVLFDDPKQMLIYCGIAITVGIVLGIVNMLITAKQFTKDPFSFMK